jgi:spore maturation protein CgeB
VHPEFVRQLQCFTVYGCFDDPESSENLSKPVAEAFDLAMVGNIAEIDTYKSWGVRNVRWWPLGFRHDDYDPSLTEQEIIKGQRDIEVALLCERVTRRRRKRLDKFAASFPNGVYYGTGWPAGFLPESQRVPTLQRTRIGINIHHSTGPINFRTFYLPANGVMQICDNKSHLGKIFELGVEVIGYDSIEEAIELTHYYIEHDAERGLIAAAGWKRSTQNYNEVACFKRVMDAITELKPIKQDQATAPKQIVVFPRKMSQLKHFTDSIALTTWKVANTLLLILRKKGKKAFIFLANFSHRSHLKVRRKIMPC